MRVLAFGASFAAKTHRRRLLQEEFVDVNTLEARLQAVARRMVSRPAGEGPQSAGGSALAMAATSGDVSPQLPSMSGGLPSMLALKTESGASMGSMQQAGQRNAVGGYWPVGSLPAQGSLPLQGGAQQGMKREGGSLSSGGMPIGNGAGDAFAAAAGGAGFAGTMASIPTLPPAF